MQVFVTGAQGQLGRALGCLGFGGGALDVTDCEAVARVFDEYRPGVVINCAAFTDVDAAESRVDEAFRVNEQGAAILALECRRRGVKLVHVSTDFVFDGKKRAPYIETDVTAPLNVYGRSKLAGERAVSASGVGGAVVRTSWLFSPWGRNFVKSIMQAASARPEITVVPGQVGSPTSAFDLARAIAAMIPRLGEMEIYHFCNTGVVSRADFAREIIRQAGFDCRVVSGDYPSAAVRPDYSALATAKFEKAFGISPGPWQEALGECIETLKKDER